MKRFNMLNVTDPYTFRIVGTNMTEATNGDYVKYSEVEALEKELAALRAVILDREEVIKTLQEDRY